jgi:hypothetical protein
VTLLHAPTSRPRIVRSNRRLTPRIPADKLPWLATAQLAARGFVSLIDLSIGGASFDVAYRLQAGDPTELELVTERERTVAIGRILRSEIVSVRRDSILYRGACAFDKPLPWRHQLTPAAAAQTFSSAGAGTFEHWPGWSEIQLVFRYGRRLEGYARAFSGRGDVIEVWPSLAALMQQRQVIPLSLLRAVKVVRDVSGEESPRVEHTDMDGGFAQVEVVFKNGHTLSGATPHYEDGDSGFWLFPQNVQVGLRIFVLSSAVAEIRVLQDPLSGIP